MTRLLTIAPLAALAACAPPPASLPPLSLQCGIIDSRDWTAWVNAMPGPNAGPTLIVTGKADTPTGGYRLAWRGIRVMESYPVQVDAELEAIPPDGPATQAVVTHDVRGQWLISPPVGSVTVRCGERILARVEPVETAR